MANIFQREPLDGGDSGVWGDKELKQNRLSIGALTCSLYDDAGALKLTKGRIGTYTGSAYGTAIIDTITTISIAGVTASNWAKVEMTVTGSGVTFAASDIVGKVDPTVIPTEFTGAYDAEKGGYYIDSAKRCVGVVYVDSLGALKGIINALSFHESYVGKTIEAGGNIIAKKTAGESKDIISYEVNKVVSLEAIAGVQGKIITFHNSGTGLIDLQPDGAETINSLTTFKLFGPNDYAKLFARNDEWKVLEHRILLDSGWISRSDWTNVHLGFATVNYNNLVGTYTVGEKVTEATSGNTGIIIKDTGAILTLIRVTGTGIFINARELTGEDSGATSDVNGNTKDVNSVCYHGLGVSNFRSKIYYSAAANFTNAIDMLNINLNFDAIAGSAIYYGLESWVIDTDNIRFQTGTSSILTLNDSGVISANGDAYYKIVIEPTF